MHQAQYNLCTSYIKYLPWILQNFEENVMSLTNQIDLLSLSFSSMHMEKVQRKTLGTEVFKTEVREII